ncbi:MAG TPA: hypothetical protein VFE53_07305 [Mucilaginibacter sp.]|jgi:hypothetical protein|nr:hypothetical protein [Mucilaginibacter sp.]
MIDALSKWNSTARFTVYPGGGHDAWTAAYGTDSLYRWMLAQEKHEFSPCPVDSLRLSGCTGNYINDNQDTLKLRLTKGVLTMTNAQGDPGG